MGTLGNFDHFVSDIKFQIFMAKKEQVDAKKIIKFFKLLKNENFSSIFVLAVGISSDSNNVANLLCLALPLTLWRLPTIKPFKFLSWKVAGSFLIE